MPIYKRKIVLIELDKLRPCSSCALSPRRVLKKPCTKERVTSWISMAKSFKLVVSITNLHKKNKRSFS